MASPVYEFDMYTDPAYLRDPHARVLELVEKAPPVFWTPSNGGHWMIVGHEAVQKASRDWTSFTSEVVPQAHIQAMMAAMPPGTPRLPQGVPINIDPPQHTIFRAPLNPLFSPKAILAMKDNIRALAVELVEAIKDKGCCEFMSAVAEPLPVQVFLNMFGLPPERQVEYRNLVSRFISTPINDMQTMFTMLRGICDVMHETVMERREHPRADIISTLWQTEIDGRATTLDDLENFNVLLFLAGLDTVINGIGFGVRHLAMNPALQQQLREDPKLIAEASEEMLRRYTFTVPTRLVAQNVEFEGANMRQGDRAFLFLPGADLDPTTFPDPGTFNLARENKVHIAFGVGPHRCLGSHLARVELQLLYSALLEHLPEFRLDPAHAVRFRGGHVIGLQNLHMKWDV